MTLDDNVSTTLCSENSSQASKENSPYYKSKQT